VLCFCGIYGTARKNASSVSLNQVGNSLSSIPIVTSIQQGFCHMKHAFHTLGELNVNF